MNRDYNKYSSFFDRFPFIIVAVIFVIAIIFVLIFKAKFTVLLSSSSSTNTTTRQQTQNTLSQTQQYPIYISSPVNEQAFDFSSKKEAVPIKVDLKKDITDTNYKLEILVITNGQIIRIFDSVPYKYDWTPEQAGEYEIVANLVDVNNNVISSSNTVKFSVKYDTGITSTTVDHSVSINLQIYEGPVYVPDNGIYYYRVEAIVNGDPLPTVVFSKDDSHGAWGPKIAQVNLRKGEFYNLEATASNSYDSQTATIMLIAPK
ncbi:MAG: hypothetical protein M1475_00705 [Actinobacteria bacterium]|nr:hypothetical protein [Cyanobacteriota bacterium]MCL6086912.1 hypothetical protein [Actinomycetota bacterium]